MTLSFERPKDDAAARAYVAQLEAEAERLMIRTDVGETVWHRWGEGPPVVLLHGGSGSWTHWVHTIPWFMESRTVLVADLPGLGDSPDPPEPCTADSLAEIIERALAQLVGSEAVDLVGFSFGGIVGGHLAAGFVERVRRLVLVGAPPFGLGTDGPANEVRAVDPSLDLESASDQHRRNLGLLMVADAERIDPLALRIHHDNLRRSRLGSRKIARAATLEATLRRVSRPVSGIWGEKDVTAHPDLESIQRFFLESGGEGSRDRSFDVLPGVGHWAPFEAPDAFNRLMEARLAET